PVVLMLLKAIVDIIIDDPTDLTQRVFDVIGNPMFALLVACLLGLFTLGRAAGFTRDRLSETVEKSLMPIAGVLLIVAAG
ncbi:gluconate transporter, partial [Streptomyces sp. SID11233]|nr:gluconate transporter [Streptomyces sp. SID11233]